MKNIINQQEVDDADKYILWQGLLNQYGMFDYNRNNVRSFNNITYADKNFKSGDLLSIDFGTSNLGNEFSYIHSGIVICEDGHLESKPIDEQESTIKLLKETYKLLKK